MYSSVLASGYAVDTHPALDTPTHTPPSPISLNLPRPNSPNPPILIHNLLPPCPCPSPCSSTSNLTPFFLTLVAATIPLPHMIVNPLKDLLLMLHQHLAKPTLRTLNQGPVSL